MQWSRQTADQPVRPGYVDVVKLVLARGADPTIIANDGTTALHLAARLGDTEIAELLVDGGANPVALDNEGESAIGAAADRGLADMVRVLAAKLPPDALPPLAAASISGDAGAVKAALAGNAAVDGKTADGFTSMRQV